MRLSVDLDNCAERPCARGLGEFCRGEQSHAGDGLQARQHTRTGETERQHHAKHPAQAALPWSTDNGSHMRTVVGEKESSDVFPISGLAEEIAVAVVVKAGNLDGTLCIIHGGPTPTPAQSDRGCRYSKKPGSKGRDIGSKARPQ